MCATQSAPHLPPTQCNPVANASNLPVAAPRECPRAHRAAQVGPQRRWVSRALAPGPFASSPPLLQALTHLGPGCRDGSHLLVDAGNVAGACLAALAGNRAGLAGRAQVQRLAREHGGVNGNRRYRDCITAPSNFWGHDRTWCGSVANWQKSGTIVGQCGPAPLLLLKLGLHVRVAGLSETLDK